MRQNPDCSTFAFFCCCFVFSWSSAFYLGWFSVPSLSHMHSYMSWYFPKGLLWGVGSSWEPWWSRPYHWTWNLNPSTCFWTHQEGQGFLRQLGNEAWPSFQPRVSALISNVLTPEGEKAAVNLNACSSCRTWEEDPLLGRLFCPWARPAVSEKPTPQLHHLFSSSCCGKYWFNFFHTRTVLKS